MPTNKNIAVATAAAAAAVLVFIYMRNKSKTKFVPIPMLTCDTPFTPEYAVDMTGRGAAGTAVWDIDEQPAGTIDKFQPYSPVPGQITSNDTGEYGISKESLLPKKRANSRAAAHFCPGGSVSLLARATGRTGAPQNPLDPPCARRITDLDSEL